jgi:ABC-type bacteriocin/lantibiotic exporter with double-glycine peptidase domain
VIIRQLTLGQLVASMLIVNMVLPALERLVRNLQNVYELLSALGKIGHVEDLPLERAGGVELPISHRGAKIVFRDVRFSYNGKGDVLSDINLEISSGERISVLGPNGAGKSTLASMLCGLVEPTHGMVEVNGVDIRDLDLQSFRKSVALVTNDNEIVEGTIEANVSLGRPEISHHDVLWALSMTGFDDEMSKLPNGVKTELINAGSNLSRGQIQKILIARAIVKRPQLLLLDEAFTGIEEKSRLEILDRFFSKQRPWTIIDISQDADTILHSSKILVMESGKFIESGGAYDLAWNQGSAFSRLFPDSAKLVRSRDKRKPEQ